MECLVSKEQRAQLTADKKQQMFDKIITKKLPAQFEYMETALDVESDKLDETYNVQRLIEHFQRVAHMYDFADTLKNVLCFDENNVSVDDSKSMNLFTQYSRITPEMVANSNKFYTSYLKDNDQILEDMELIYHFLLNNMVDELYDNIHSQYNQFEIGEKGGPLLFIIMIKQLQSSNERVADYIKKQIEQLKLTDLDGEDVNHAINLMKSAWLRLGGDDNDTLVPKNYKKQVLSPANFLSPGI